MSEPPVNVSTLRKMKQDGQPIACLTAYDASYAQLVDAAGTDLVLVGDSLGMVIQGHDTTVPVTVDDIVYHSQSVARGLRRAFLVADMPFVALFVVLIFVIAAPIAWVVLMAIPLFLLLAWRSGRVMENVTSDEREAGI
ncbi:MAG: 3-methyl-2-oxobutanoate hydroxymethyltransferase, partial [Proteobacteria bacterium]|nr:3-methyl-2-oxobutanoate hydroxymethyltransferase [Pseudomonadota bacterium]